MTAQRKERCETCRWWERQPSRWSMTVEQEADWNLRAFGGAKGPTAMAMAEKIRKEREEIEAVGYGTCHAMPEPIPGKRGSHFCGQWRDTSEEDPQTLKEGEIVVRVDVLNAFRISLADIREMVEAMKGKG